MAVRQGAAGQVRRHRHPFDRSRRIAHPGVVWDAAMSRRCVLGGLAAGLAAGLADWTASRWTAGEPASLLMRAVWGAYASTEPYPDCSSHYALERMLGTRLPWMSWFFNWNVSWPTVGGEQAAETGHNVLIAWQPQH